MEIRQLKHFLAVLDHGSISKAAEALGISHQGLSKSIAALEESLHLPLLVRGSRGVTPSAFGQVLSEYARFIDGEHDNAMHALAALRGGGGGGHLTVATGISAATSLVPQAAARLFARRPGTSLTVLSGPYAQFRGAVESGEIALFVGTVLEDAVSPLVTVERLFVDQDYIVARRDHALARRGSVALADLSAWPWVFSVGTHAFRRNFVRVFEAGGATAPRSLIESDSLDVTKAALVHSDFLTLLPRQAFAAEERAGLLAVVPFDSSAWSRPVSLAYRRRGVRFGLVDSLLEELRGAASALAGVRRDGAATD